MVEIATRLEYCRSPGMYKTDSSAVPANQLLTGVCLCIGKLIGK